MGQTCPNFTGVFGPERPFGFYQEKGDCSRIEKIVGERRETFYVGDVVDTVREIHMKTYFTQNEFVREFNSLSDQPVSDTPEKKKLYSGLIKIQLTQDSNRDLIETEEFFDKQGIRIQGYAKPFKRIQQ